VITSVYMSDQVSLRMRADEPATVATTSVVIVPDDIST